MIVEPGGAVGFAAAVRAGQSRPGQHVCGGNMPVERLEKMRALAGQQP